MFVFSRYAAKIQKNKRINKYFVLKKHKKQSFLTA